ncbi:hypothetical protein MDAP_000156 [Mitosporidium daphniae]
MLDSSFEFEFLPNTRWSRAFSTKGIPCEMKGLNHGIGLSFQPMSNPDLNSISIMPSSAIDSNFLMESCQNSARHSHIDSELEELETLLTDIREEG